MEDDAVRCCICNEEYDPEEPYARLSLHIERLDRRGTINILDDFYAGAYCRPSCLRELWDRLAAALPEGCAKHAEGSLELLSEHKE